MLPAILILGLALGCIQLGRAGFSPEGLPFDTTTRIKGKPAKIIGTICWILGIGLAGFGIMIFFVGTK